MGIQVEFNPDLALRNISYYKNGERNIEECIPEKLEIGNIYNFLKKGQRNYYLLDDTPVPLLETQGNSILSRPLASIKILKSTHFNINGEIWTKGKYRIENIYDINNSKIYFEGFNLIK